MNRKLRNEELGRASLEEYKTLKKQPIVLVLDNIRSLSNIGSAFRTGDAFLIEKIYLCGITATPPHREIQKTALGATESVAWEYQDSTTECVARLKKEGYTAVAVEQVENSIPLQEFTSSDQPIALVFGHEVNGVEQEVIDSCDCSIEIPQHGTKHSLNISVSVGVVLWEITKP